MHNDLLFISVNLYYYQPAIALKREESPDSKGQHTG